MVITSLIGMFAISGGLEGYMKKKLPWWQRIISVIGGLLMIDQDCYRPNWNCNDWRSCHISVCSKTVNPKLKLK